MAASFESAARVETGTPSNAMARAMPREIFFIGAPSAEAYRKAATGTIPPPARLARSARRRPLRIELLELGLVVDQRERRVAARPVGVPEAGPPRFHDRVERFGLLVDRAERAGGVVQHHRFVGAERHREIRLAHRVVHAPVLRVVGAEEDPGA